MKELKPQTKNDISQILMELGTQEEILGEELIERGHTKLANGDIIISDESYTTYLSTDNKTYIVQTKLKEPYFNIIRGMLIIYDYNTYLISCERDEVDPDVQFRRTLMALEENELYELAQDIFTQYSIENNQENKIQN